MENAREERERRDQARVNVSQSTVASQKVSAESNIVQVIRQQLKRAKIDPKQIKYCPVVKGRR
jgi:acyl transferase domain-containing protein